MASQNRCVPMCMTTTWNWHWEKICWKSIGTLQWLVRIFKTWGPSTSIDCDQSSAVTWMQTVGRSWLFFGEDSHVENPQMQPTTWDSLRQSSSSMTIFKLCQTVCQSIISLTAMTAPYQGMALMVGATAVTPATERRTSSGGDSEVPHVVVGSQLDFTWWSSTSVGDTESVLESGLESKNWMWLEIKLVGQIFSITVE